MKITLTILLILFYIESFCQVNFAGTYINNNGEKIILKSDFTFKHTWSYLLTSSWTIGTWQTKGDTLFLEKQLVIDTVKNQGYLVLSEDEIANSINREQSLMASLSSRGQYRARPPKMLKIEEDKLFIIYITGKVYKRRFKNKRINKKYKTYFRKVL